MANNCYNLFDFYGNSKVLKQVKEWKEALANVPVTKEDPYCMRAVLEVFYPEVEDKNSIDLGSKWAHEDEDSIGAGEDQIGLVSAWGAPHELQKRMTKLLYKIDKHVIIENNFNIEDGSQGIAYTTPEDENSIYFQDVYAELDEDYDDDDDAMENLQGRLSGMDLEILDFLMDDVAGTAKVIKKHKPHLKDKFDWTKYK